MVKYPQMKKDKKFVVADNIKGIADYAFSGAIYLEEITLPNSSKFKIGTEAFKGCDALHKIISVCEDIDDIIIDETAFNGFNVDDCVLYIPSGSRWAYKHHPGFSKFKNIEISNS